MKPKGTVYELGRSGTHGEVILLLPHFLRLIYRFLRITGAGFISFALLILSFSLGPVLEQEIAFSLGRSTDKLSQTSDQDFNLKIAKAQKILEAQKEAQNFGVNSYFSVVIPKISASSNVIANVDPANKSEYLEALKQGVAHAKGTYFPGQTGRIFLFSHSTDSPLNFARYNAVFYLLRKLEAKDEIIVFFADKKYTYEVVDKVITKPGDTSWLKPKEGEEELILMTCDPPGTTWNRLLIIAKPV